MTWPPGVGSHRIVRPVRASLVCVALALVSATCAAPPAATPSITPGTTARPRDVNIIASDYAFTPPVVELVPGETVLLHIINGGLAVHEAIIGSTAVQDAWEAAEAAVADAPPGPTPAVSVDPRLAGLRIVVLSGERKDVLFTVPSSSDELIVGCHVPGHWARGMHVPVRLVRLGLPTQPAGSA